jgi:hypothetical protein
MSARSTSASCRAATGNICRKSKPDASIPVAVCDFENIKRSTWLIESFESTSEHAAHLAPMDCGGVFDFEE